MLEVNDSAVKVLGDDNLRIFARELLKAVRASVTIDWTAREKVHAQLRVISKCKHVYPPDKQQETRQTVAVQAEVLSEMWAAA